MRWKTVARVGACLCVAAAGAIGSVDILADRVVRAAFDRVGALGKSPTADQVSVESGALLLRGLKWTMAGASVRIGSVRLSPDAKNSFLGGSAWALDASGSLSLENVAIDTAFESFKIRRIDLAGASNSAGELALIFDPQSSTPFADRLAGLSAATVAIPELIASTKFASIEQTTTYRDILLKDVVRGKAAAVTVEGASFSINGAELGESEGAYGRMIAKAVDLVLAARIMAGSISDPAEAKSLLYDEAEIEGFHLSNTRAHFEIGAGAIKAAGVRGRPMRADRAGAAADAVQEAERSFPSFYADLFDSVAIDQLKISDLKFNADGDRPARVSIGEIAIKGFRDRRIEALEIENLDFASHAAKIGVEKLAFQGIGVARLQNALGPMQGKSLETAVGAVGPDSAPPFEVLALNGLHAAVADARPGREGSRCEFAASRLEFRGAYHADGAPARIDALLEHLTYRLDQGGDAAPKALASMGYSELDLSSHIAMAWDEKSRDLAVETITFQGADMGSLRLSGLLSNVSRDLFTTERTTAIVAALAATVKKIDLSIENTGFFDRLLVSQAERQHKSIADMRRTYARAAGVYLPMLLENGPAAQTISAALAQFIANPKTFHMVVAAPEGLSLADLTAIQAPGALLTKLQVEATANE
ncbi:hypothetical protein [Methylocapsa acidiphila]|uniref:hypothetical protein n=1 Tax=Methylocapsa acidiphila TaxID=133552 RepID=UPI000420B41C|nr:hypothetical protein [Methylocapsa acidiphila]